MNSLELKDSIFPNILTNKIGNTLYMISTVRKKFENEYYLGCIRVDANVDKSSEIEALKAFVKNCYNYSQTPVLTTLCEKNKNQSEVIVVDILDENQEELPIN